MAGSDARVEYLEYELREREKEIKKMTDGEKNQPNSENRIRDLESKVKEMEALVKGLTEELLDLKSILMKISSKEEERHRAAVPAQRVTPQEMVLRQRKQPATAEPPRPEAKDAGELNLIMQSDGTLKPERRSEGGLIVAGHRANVRIGMKGSTKGKIITEEEGKKEQGDLIVATDDDVEKKKKK